MSEEENLQPQNAREEQPSAAQAEPQAEECRRGEGCEDKENCGKKEGCGKKENCGHGEEHEKHCRREKMKEELEAARAEAADYKDKWMRSAAEFDNFRKRNEQTRRNAYLDGKGEILLKIFPIGVTGKISAPTVVTFIHAHHRAFPKLWRLGLTWIS